MSYYTIQGTGWPNVYQHHRFPHHHQITLPLDTAKHQKLDLPLLERQFRTLQGLTLNQYKIISEQDGLETIIKEAHTASKDTHYEKKRNFVW